MGVDLHTSESGGLHESVAGLKLIDPFGERPDLEAVVGTEQHGPGFDGDLLIISRTVTLAGDGLGEVSTEKIGPPTQTETDAVHAALDYLGYAGPREIRTRCCLVRSPGCRGGRADGVELLVRCRPCGRRGHAEEESAK